MRSTMQQFNTTLSLSEMEAMIRRVVKEAVSEEFTRLLQQRPGAVAENWAHEGEDDPAGDELLLAEALAVRERYRTNPAGRVDWATFKAEIAEGQPGDLDKRRLFHAALLASGLVKEIKPPPLAGRSQRRLIQVQGKPVSQTIIEERR